MAKCYGCEESKVEKVVSGKFNFKKKIKKNNENIKKNFKRNTKKTNQLWSIIYKNGIVK
jgi:hypothetical protein